MFLELARRPSQHLMFMYWCLRPSGASGNPPRSTYFADRLVQCTDQRELDAYFVSVTRVATHLARQSHGRQQFWDLSGLSSTNGTAWAQHQQSLRTLFPSLELAVTSTRTLGAPRVVLCLDEASTLLTHGEPDGAFLRKVCLAAESARVQLVLADTQSKINNFASGESQRILPSHRPKAAILGTLAAPWVTFNVVDFDDFVETRIPVGARMTHQLDVSKALLLGRPLWCSIFCERNHDLLQLRAVAIAKLLCGFDAASLLQPTALLNQPPALAIVASRVVLPNVSSFDYAAVVASHMATCIGTSTSREQVHAQYFSEPILAEAAAMVLRYSHTKDLMHQIIEAVTRAWRQDASIVGAGMRGEVAVQLLACLAKDSIVCASDQTNMLDALFTTEVSAVEFLRVMGELPRSAVETPAPAAASTTEARASVTKKAQEEADYRQQLQGFNGALVSFTHFMSITDSAWCSNTLQRLYMRAAALVVKAGTAGSDLLIPVRFAPSAQDGTPRFGAILIQVKNYDEKTALDAYASLAASTLAAVKESSILRKYLTGMVYVLGGPGKSRTVHHHFFSSVEIRKPRYADPCSHGSCWPMLIDDCVCHCVCCAASATTKTKAKGEQAAPQERINVNYGCVVVRHPQMPFITEASRTALHEMRTCTFNALTSFAQVYGNELQATQLAKVWALHLPEPEVCSLCSSSSSHTHSRGRRSDKEEHESALCEEG